jgi:hypothetical protein
VTESGAEVEAADEPDEPDEPDETRPESPESEAEVEVEVEVEAPESETEAEDEAAEPVRRRTGAGRDRRIVVAAVVAVVCLTLGGVLAFVSRSGGGGGGGDDSGPSPHQTSTTLETGGIDVDAPDGWTVAPLPQFGFGIAVPPGWEAVVLSPEMLNSLNGSDPAVTGFVDAANAAAEAGSVFYAAGQDRQGRVTDLKVGAVPDAGIEDVGALEDYARQLAADRGVGSPTIERVDDADRPTVRIGFRTTSRSEQGDEITTHGVETLIVGPGDTVWSIIVTSEDRAMLDDLTPRILDTLTFAPARDSAG